jgi:hypothetical protein
MKGKLAAFFIQEKSQGHLSKKADAERMAGFCIAAIQGAMLMGKIARNSRPVENAVQEALAHLKSHSTTSRREARGRRGAEKKEDMR